MPQGYRGSSRAPSDTESASGDHWAVYAPRPSLAAVLMAGLPLPHWNSSVYIVCVRN